VRTFVLIDCYFNQITRCCEVDKRRRENIEELVDEKINTFARTCSRQLTQFDQMIHREMFVVFSLFAIVFGAQWQIDLSVTFVGCPSTAKIMWTNLRGEPIGVARAIRTMEAQGRISSFGTCRPLASK
jgi:hypothetical protein